MLNRLKFDIFAVLILLVIFTPIYLFNLYNIPYQVNTDEIVALGLVKEAKIDSGLLSLTNYHGLPGLSYFLYRILAEKLDGVTLLNLRLIHAFSGLLTVIICYLFFRLIFVSEAFKSQTLALGGAMILGSQHVFLSVGRMALRENTAVLFELGSLIFIILAIKFNKFFYYLLCGAISGLTLYGYYSGRVTVIMWLAFFLILLISRKERFRNLSKGFLFSLLGFLLVAFPIILSTINSPIYESGYMKKQLLIFSEGIEEQKTSVGTTNVSQAIFVNALNGLTVFNNQVPDKGNIYFNPGFGFLDPLSGILVWIGVIALVKKQKRIRREAILIMSSWLFLYLTFAFLVNKNPHYIRMLIILPFISALIVHGIESFCNLIGNYKTIIFGVIILAIFSLNIMAFVNFASMGLVLGDDVGGTVRYVESRKYFQEYAFYVATNDQYPFFKWNRENWVRVMVSNNQIGVMISPDELSNPIQNKPFTIFMSEKLWEDSGQVIKALYPNFRLENIKPYGSLVAIEVLE